MKIALRVTVALGARTLGCIAPAASITALWQGQPDSFAVDAAASDSASRDFCIRRHRRHRTASGTSQYGQKPRRLGKLCRVPNSQRFLALRAWPIQIRRNTDFAHRSEATSRHAPSTRESTQPPLQKRFTFHQSGRISTSACSPRSIGTELLVRAGTETDAFHVRTLLIWSTQT